jgi:5-methylcytosine-specific restriction endonuclease McrA
MTTKQQYAQTYYLEHRDKARTRSKVRRNNKRDEYLAYLKRYRETHREEARVAHAAWKAENREGFLAYQRRYNERRAVGKRVYQSAWRRRNSDLVVTQQNRRRATVSGKLDAVDWKAIKAGQFGRCFDCAVETKLTIGHLVPLCRGGTNEILNIVGQCRSCNAKQGRNIHPSVRMVR